MAKKTLTHNLFEPLNGTRTARFDIHTGTGNLAIDRLQNSEGCLACGEMEYLEKQDPPAWTVDAQEGRTILKLKASGGLRSGFQLPWGACKGVTNWQIHVNPTVSSDISAYSGGGNLKLDLTGMDITRVSADSGGGNLDLILPEGATQLCVTAKTGGGNVSLELGSGTTGSSTLTAASGAGKVEVRLPAGIAALIHATTGLGKVIVDPRFSQIDKNTYQSPDYDLAADRVEISARSGAGEVRVTVS